MAQFDARHGKLNIRAMAKNPRSIAIVDDDPSALKALARLLGAHYLRPRLTSRRRSSSLRSRKGCRVPDRRLADAGDDRPRASAQSGAPRVQIPTIIITAHDEAGMRERCKSAGAIAYLAKPVSDTSLFAAIDSAGTDPRAKPPSIQRRARHEGIERRQNWPR